ncbi:unnamed protein product [Caenorhabditis auriculariae]|uniref:Uncharacterized protein n=1 Tax=Caenorhabditis auriculariae TaxID=2777116 RepID=A0A8S1HK74_9PELO|nr:unnamed protein product [Caenorhabditis auriculariae]
MDSLELDADAFYICTELSPRCYVVQKAIQIDKSQIERMVGELEKNAAGNSATAGSAAGPSSSTGYVHAPPAPPLPYWFTRECKEKMLKCESPAQSVASGSFTPTPPTAMPVPDLKQQLKAQLEYYFSR